MAPGNPIDEHDLPRRDPHGTTIEDVVPVDDAAELAALRAASDHTGPLEIITPDMLSRVRDGLDAQPG